MTSNICLGDNIEFLKPYKHYLGCITRWCGTYPSQLKAEMKPIERGWGKSTIKTAFQQTSHAFGYLTEAWPMQMSQPKDGSKLEFELRV